MSGQVPLANSVARATVRRTVRSSGNIDRSPEEAGRQPEIPLASQSMGVSLRRAWSRPGEEKAFNFAKRGSPHTVTNRCGHDRSRRRSTIGYLRHEPPRSFRSGTDREFHGKPSRSQLVNPAARSSSRLGRPVLAFRWRAGSSSRIHGRRRLCRRRGIAGPGFRPVARRRKYVAPGASVRRPDGRRASRTRRPSAVPVQGFGLGVGNVSGFCRRPGGPEASLRSGTRARPTG